MAPTTVVVDLGGRNVTMRTGWVQAPNFRGTSDIVWSCLFTIFLCSWSILCLNLPADHEKYWHRLRRKTYWFLLSMIGPEVIFQLALGEWLLARKWRRNMRDLGYMNWTMTHSFYANMGGFHLDTTDHGHSPINGAQLHWLLEHKYIELPDIKRKQILDKNKAEAVVRVLTLGQIAWFLMNCIGRAISNLALTSFELSTLAFISSAVGTFFCWFHKPMDVETPNKVVLDKPLDDILHLHGKQNDNWIQTPLDFIDRRRAWPWQLYWRYGLAILGNFLDNPRLMMKPRTQPIDRIPDDVWHEPTLRSLPALFTFHTMYAAILMAGWNLELPSYTELLLWRISSAIQLGTIVVTWFTMPFQIKDASQKVHGVTRAFTFSNRMEPDSSPIALSTTPDILPRAHLDYFSKPNGASVSLSLATAAPAHPTRTSSYPLSPTWIKEKSHIPSWQSKAERVRTLISDDPIWKISIRLLIIYHGCWLVYMVARMYIIVEDVVSLRALPVSALQTPNWPVWFPHI